MVIYLPHCIVKKVAAENLSLADLLIPNVTTSFNAVLRTFIILLNLFNGVSLSLWRVPSSVAIVFSCR